jgi:hypothetical protein
MKTNVNVWKQGLLANNAVKNQIQSLDFVVKTINDLAREKGNDVSAYFDAVGLDRMPKSGAPSAKGVFLTTDLVVKYWDCKDTDGNLCRKTKEGLKAVEKFTPFGVIKAIYNLNKENVSKERKAVKKSVKKAAKAQKATKKVATAKAA